MRIRPQHGYIVGVTGTGEPMLLLSLILQDLDAGPGVGLLDPHGDLVWVILARMPQHRRGADAHRPRLSGTGRPETHHPAIRQLWGPRVRASAGQCRRSGAQQAGRVSRRPPRPQPVRRTAFPGRPAVDPRQCRHLRRLPPGGRRVSRELGEFTPQEFVLLGVGEAVARAGTPHPPFNLQTYPEPPAEEGRRSAAPPRPGPRKRKRRRGRSRPEVPPVEPLREPEEDDLVN